MTARDWLCVGLILVGVFLFVIQWFIPKWTGMEPEGVIVCFTIASLLACVTGVINLGLWS